MTRSEPFTLLPRLELGIHLPVSQVAGILNHHTLLDEVLIDDIVIIICIYIIKKVHCGLDI